jgi:hypothetical protein
MYYDNESQSESDLESEQAQLKKLVGELYQNPADYQAILQQYPREIICATDKFEQSLLLI